MKIASEIMVRGAGLEGEESTDVVLKCYYAILDTGESATTPEEYQALQAAGTRLDLYPNLEVTPLGREAIQKAFAS